MKKVFEYFITILLALGWGLTISFFVFAYPKVEVQIVDRIKEVKVESATACAPCIDEPMFNKCNFGDLAYEALQTKYDIYGQKELSKGDIYYLTDNIFSTNFVNFCKQQAKENDRCFPIEVILNKKLFKPIN